MTRGTKISVVVPVFNEEKSLLILYEKLKQVLSTTSLQYEIIFVDDGSQDSSFTIIKKIYQKDKNHTRYIKMRKNFGKGEAISSGFDFAQGEVVVTLDADLQDDPREISKLISKLDKGYDVVSGWKIHRQDPWTKTLPSYFFNLAASKLLGFRVHDLNSGLKIYKRKVLNEVKIRADLYRFIFLLASRLGFKVVEVPVHHKKRLYGKSKYGFKRFISGFIDLLTVFFLTRYKAKPSHFFGISGALLLSAGVLFDGYVAIVKLLTGSTQGHIPLLLFGILLIIVGVQLISLGLLGELYLTGSEEYRYRIEHSSYRGKTNRPSI